MIVEILKWWENHHHGLTSQTAVIVLKNGKISDIYPDRTEKASPTELLGLPSVRTSREQVLSLVEAYNREQDQVDVCPRGCSYNKEILEGLHCTGGVRLTRLGLSQLWEEEVEGLVDPQDADPKLISRILQLIQMEKSGNIRVLDQKFEVEPGAFIKYHER